MLLQNAVGGGGGGVQVKVIFWRGGNTRRDIQLKINLHMKILSLIEFLTFKLIQKITLSVRSSVRPLKQLRGKLFFNIKRRL